MPKSNFVNDTLSILSSSLRSNPNVTFLAENWHKMVRGDSFRDAYLGIVLSGLLNKFEQPNEATSDQRRAEAILRFISEDRGLRQNIVSDPYRKNEVFNFASSWIEQTLIGELDYADAWFGPGSCYDSHKGYHSPLSKLNQRPYTVTEKASDDAVELIISNRQWRRSLITEYRKIHGTLDHGPVMNRILFRKFLKDNMKFVSGSHLTTVPKNNEKDRDICIEPKLNMMLQKMVGSMIRKSLRNIGWNLDKGQSIHAERIKDRSLATIDLKSASNMIDLGLVQTLVPNWLYDKLCTYRSEFTEIRESGKSFRGFRLEKISSMGNGFTFELMTLILMSIGRYFDPDMTVYGDDIVIKQDVAHDFISFLSSNTNFIVNVEKSFFDGFIRESCGAFYVEDTRVVRFDFRWSQGIPDDIVLANKLHLIKDDLNRKSEVLDSTVFRFVYNKICSAHLSILEKMRSQNKKFLLYPEGPVGINPSALWVFRDSFILQKRMPAAVTREYAKTLDRLQYKSDMLFPVPAYTFDSSRGRGGARVKNHCRSKDPIRLMILLKDMQLPVVLKRGAGEWLIRYALVDAFGRFHSWLGSARNLQSPFLKNPSS